MKKLFFLIVAVIALASCNSKAKKSVETIAETLTDSVFNMGNDMDDLQSYTYEGVVPNDGNGGTEYQLVLREVTPDSIGTYTITSMPVNPKTGKDEAVRDSGLVITVVGLPGDSAAVVYQLISADVTNKKQHVVAHNDSTLMMVHDINHIDKNKDVMLKKVHK